MGVYGTIKYCGELIVKAYHDVFDIPYTIVRPSALYGERCVSRRVGQVFIEKALSGETLLIDGDGQDRLDFTYIDDLVNGVCLAIEKPVARNQIFNMTYGASRSVSDLVNITKEYFPKVEIESRERDHLTPTRGTLNIRKAQQMLDYSPQHPLEVGFPKYVNWYKELSEFDNDTQI